MAKSVSRREFLSQLAGMGVGVATCGLSLSPRLLMAQTSSLGSDKNLVVINLDGGLDGLAAFPFVDGSFASILSTQFRPTLSLPSADIIRALPQGGSAQPLGFHPAWGPLLSVAASHVAVIQGYGLPGIIEGRSHETCAHLMNLGATRLAYGSENVGFLSRIMDLNSWDSYQYWALGRISDTNVNALRKRPITASDFDDFVPANLGPESGNERNFCGQVAQELIQLQQPRTSIAAKYLDSRDLMYSSVATIRNDIAVQQVGNIPGLGDYSTYDTGPNLRDIAKILAAKVNRPALGLQGKDMLLLCEQDGFDTHGDQNNPATGGLNRQLVGLAHKLAVFVRDLERLGIFEKTLIVLYSEFGRGVYENGTRGTPAVGTDHGSGGTSLVLGGAVRPGVYGEAPSLAELSDPTFNALPVKIDYRDIFSEALNWLSINPEQIFTEAGYRSQRIGFMA